MSIITRPIESNRELKQFVRFPWQIYKNDPHWVPPLIGDKIKFLDKKKGVFFEFGEAEYFLAYKDGQLVGRIDAHVDHQYEKYHDTDTGFFGFFECINDQEVANALFKAAETWLRKKGKSKMLGPESFTIYDETAMLYEGFDSCPVILLPYNPPYYNDLVTAYGFEKAIDWYAFMVSRDVQLRPVMYKVRDRVLNRHNITIKPLNMKEYNRHLDEVKVIFKDAWMGNWGHTPLTDKQYEHFVSELKLVIKPELTYFAEVDGKTVGFSLTVVDANPAIKRANGRLFPFGLIKILLGLKKIKRLRTLAMGVLPEYRHRGLDIAFYLETIDVGKRLGFEESECSVIVETNERMIRALEDLGAKKYKTYRIYEKSIQQQ